MTINASFYTVYSSPAFCWWCRCSKSSPRLAYRHRDGADHYHGDANPAHRRVMLKSYFDTIPDEIEEAAMMVASTVCKSSSVSPCPWRCRGDIRVRLLLYGGMERLSVCVDFLSSASNFTLPVGLNALFSSLITSGDG